MPSILKFFRITVFLVLYFFLCMVVVTTSLQGWPVGSQMLFAFGVSVILFWRQEKWRLRKFAAKAQAKGSSETRTHRPKPVPRPSAYNKRVERERERTCEANASEPSGNRYQKRSNAEIIAVAKKATPALAVAEKRRAVARETRVASRTDAAAGTAQPTFTRDADIFRIHKTGWIAARETVLVAGRNIDGMVYVGTPPLLNT